MLRSVCEDDVSLYIRRGMDFESIVRSVVYMTGNGGGTMVVLYIVTIPR